MSKCPLPGPFYGNLGQPITPDHEDFVVRLGESELRACIRAGFRTAECFFALSKLNRQLCICRAVFEARFNDDK
jgi:hypothetical protein